MTTKVLSIDLQGNVGVLPRNVVQLLGLKNLQVVTNQSTSILRIDDIVDEPTLCRNHGVGESRRVFIGVFLKILKSKNEIEKVSYES